MTNEQLAQIGAAMTVAVTQAQKTVADIARAFDPSVKETMLTTEQIIERLRELGCTLMIHPPYRESACYINATGHAIAAGASGATLNEALVKLLVRVEEQVKEVRG